MAELPSLVAALLAWIAVGLLPGYAVARWLDPRSGRLAALGIAPLVSFGVVLVVAQLATPSHSFRGPLAWCTALLAVSATAVAEWRQRFERPPMVDRWLAGLISAGPIAAVAIMILGSPGIATEVPNDDGVNHGIMASLVERTGGISVSEVVVADTASGEQASGYYPLGLHAMAVQIRLLSGASVSLALLVAVMASVAVCLPLGTCAAGRTVFGLTPRWGAAAGLAAVTVPNLPWILVVSGLLPLMLGLAVVPALAERAQVALSIQGNWLGPIAVAATAAVGLVGVHVSELVAVALAVGLGATVDSALRRPVGEVTRRGAVLIAMVVLAALPQLLGLVAGTTERVGVDALPSTGWIAAVPSVLLLSLGFVAPVAGWLLVTYLGGGRALIHGNGRGWTTAVVLLMALAGWLLATDARLAELVAVPWYSGPWRLLLNVNALALPLAGVGLATLAGVLARFGRIRGWPAALAPGIAGGLMGAVALAGATASVEAHQMGYREGTIASLDAQAASAFLRDRVPSDERVLNGGGGARWMFAWEGVHPLIGVGGTAGGDWGGHAWLVENAPRARLDARVDAELDQWSIRYAIAGDTTMKGRPVVDADAMAAAPGWREVFQSGPVVVYQRVQPST